MKQVKNAIIDNPYIRPADNAPAETLIYKIFNNANTNVAKTFPQLDNLEYIIVLLGQTDWSVKPDVLKFINKDYLEHIKNRKCFFVFDASLEGWSPTGDYSIFDYLYASCKAHDIDPNMIIYLTGNLRDEENIKEYSANHKCQPLHVISFPIFERAVSNDKEVTDSRGNFYTEEHLLANAEQECRRRFEDKIFSSLSRANRENRAFGTFLLCRHPIARQALISHNQITNDMAEAIKARADKLRYKRKAVREWIRSLPLVIDQSNFNENWAITAEWGHLHDQTLFQVVNETHSENFNGTSMFFSEKTFKPMIKCQPFVIYGQQGCNHKLKELGYKLYDEWFDLSFDFEQDNTERYLKMLKSVNKACYHLSRLSREQQIEWRFKNRATLMHNCRVVQESMYTRNKLYYFFKNLHP